MIKLIIPKKKNININKKSTLSICYDLYYHKIWFVRKLFQTRLKKTLKLIPNKRYNLSLDIETGTLLLTLSKISDKVISYELKNEKKII